MPVVTVQLWEGRSQEQKRALVASITHAMVEHAEADPSGLHVILQEVPPANWGRAGILGSERVSNRHERPPATVGLSHLLLQVSDLRVSESFYIDALGFTVKSRGEFSDGRPLTVFVQGMGLTEGGPRPPGPVEHVAFKVRGLDAYPPKVEAAGGKVLSGPAPGAYGRSLYLEDPDGNKIELHGD